MTVHFAAARKPERSVVARILRRPDLGPIANDNGDSVFSDRQLQATLRHFAKHGLGAAQAARDEAEKAFFAGDRESYDWWLGICRTLDRRVAEQVERREALSDTL
ncbi:hypothetical protein [Erythrobacter sp. HKB08]|uniref:hypothetical protein n=1 Tax=Erythrobacter sp. HKB08 TaxID=2502843 RepID=UPI001008A1B6|nr:hypothetical protein [Erythrobacter sp. HKB08]